MISKQESKSNWPQFKIAFDKFGQNCLKKVETAKQSYTKTAKYITSIYVTIKHSMLTENNTTQLCIKQV